MFKVLFSGTIGSLLVLITIAMWYGMYNSLFRILLGYLFHRFAHIEHHHHGHSHGHDHADHSHDDLDREHDYNPHDQGHHHSPVEDNVKNMWKGIGKIVNRIVFSPITWVMRTIFGKHVQFKATLQWLLRVAFLILAVVSAWIGSFFEWHGWDALLHFGIPVIAIGIVSMPEAMWHHRPWNRNQVSSHGDAPTNEQAWFFICIPILICFVIYLAYHYFRVAEWILVHIIGPGWQ